MNSSMYNCASCNSGFTIKKLYESHIRKHCSVCGLLFDSVYATKYHEETLHLKIRKTGGMVEIEAQPPTKKFKINNDMPSTSSAGRINERKQYNVVGEQIKTNTYFCEDCKQEFSSKRGHVRSSLHREKVTNQLEESINLVRSSFKGRILSYEYINKNNRIIPEEFLLEAKSAFMKLLLNRLEEFINLKFNIELVAEYVKPHRAASKSVSEGKTSRRNDDYGISSPEVFKHISKMTLVTVADEIEEIFQDHMDKIRSKMSEFQERDSGWAMQRMIKLEINLNKASLTKGSNFIKTPKELVKKGALVNIENKHDVFCFKWSLVAALDVTPLHNRSLTTSYDIDITSQCLTLQTGITLNFKNLEFPLAIKHIKQFEANNKEISINVFGYEGGKIVGPYYLTKAEKDIHVNLMMLHERDTFHYIWIEDMSRLLRSQITSHHAAVYICNGCIQHFGTETLLKRHKPECGGVVTYLPKEDNAVLKYKRYERQLDVPFVVYADFECVLEDVVDVGTQNTKSLKKHIPCAFSYNIKCSYDSSLDKFRLYTGVDASKKFLEYIVGDCKEIYNNYLSIKKPMDSLTFYDEIDFYTTELCHICKTSLESDKVRDHCHLTGKYRGAAHNRCNLQHQVAKFIPILFHNFSSYDSHLFIKDLIDCEGETRVIPLNKELYISLSQIIPINGKDPLELRFLDSFRFMAASLDTLAKNLPEDSLHSVRNHFPTIDQFTLMKKKGIFPYDYVSNFQKFSENVLPPRNEFYNHLTDTECSLEDYKHAQDVWSKFNCRSLQDYMELYLKTDVLLLTDVFENFRAVCLKIHELDPCHYFTAPGLSWDAMLKLTKIELQLLTDIDMYNFCKNGVRGGIVQCSKRHTVANNKYMSNYDVSKPSEMLMYLDANNLYGWAMSQSLPVNNFKWLEGVEFDKLTSTSTIMNIADDAPTGYIFDVNLEYPNHLHNAHNDLPFCAENKKVGTSKVKKLIADFSEKRSYSIHYRVLKQCLKHGLILKKVNRILSFSQCNWLEDYIVKNNTHRAAAQNTFEKDFFKLLNNAVYGKTMENVDKRKDIKIVKYWERTNRNRLGAQALIAKPNFNSLSQFSENMVAIQLDRVSVLYDKPIYLGFCVLELSKWYMYDFLYDFIKVKFQNDCILNYMDTDSFIFTIIGRDFYKELTLEELRNRFDTSEYPPDNQFDIPLLNKKKLGMMKDENCGKIMLEFVGLRPKMYAIKVQDSKEIKKSKGVKRSVLRNYTIDTYRDCLLNKKKFCDNMISFRSKKHVIFTNKVNKITLSYDDDKRKIKPDGIHTFAWGHHEIEAAIEIDNLMNQDPFEGFDNDINTMDLASLDDLNDLNL